MPRTSSIPDALQHFHDEPNVHARGFRSMFFAPALHPEPRPERCVTGPRKKHARLLENRRSSCSSARLEPWARSSIPGSPRTS